MARNFYQILQIPTTATSKEIKQAYRNLAKKYHPDKNPGNLQFEEEFKLISQAYNTLSDENKKWVYDMTLYVQQNPTVNTRSTASPTTPYTSHQDTYYRRKRRYRPPVYAAPPPQKYSLKTYLQVVSFIFVLVIAVVICIFLLNRYSSKYYYQEALKDYERGHYHSALSNLEFSISDFGNKNPNAYILASKILIYEFEDFHEALNFLEKALLNGNVEENLAEFHYLRGLCLKNKGMFGEAYESYKTSIAHNAKYDSSYYELGEINTFIFENYLEGIENFNQLLSINSKFSDAYLGKGICYQKLDEHGLAVLNFDKFISLNNSEGTAYYLKSISEIELNNLNHACEDLKHAYDRGIDEADELRRKYCRD